MDRPLIGIYPGTFDPITNGHLDLIERACRVLDELIVAVADNPEKETMFSTAERMAFIEGAVGDRSDVKVVSISGLTAEFAKDIGAQVILRGLRAISDFEYEFQMALMNRRINPDAETLYLMPSRRFVYLSSSLVKNVAGHGGDVGGLVPDPVLIALNERFGNDK
jgi:pantetheine-phosphate adenylyltransferase